MAFIPHFLTLKQIYSFIVTIIITNKLIKVIVKTIATNIKLNASNFIYSLLNLSIKSFPSSKLRLFF